VPAWRRLSRSPFRLGIGCARAHYPLPLALPQGLRGGLANLPSQPSISRALYLIASRNSCRGAGLSRV